MADVDSAAVRALPGHCLLSSAEMAGRRVAAFMIRQGNPAIRALHHVTASAAGYEGGVSTAVEKENHLLFFFQAPVDLLVKSHAEHSFVAQTSTPLACPHLHRRKRRIVETVFQFDELKHSRSAR